MAKRKPTRKKTTADPRALMEMMAGKWVSQAVSVAVELGIPDRLSGGAKSVAELAGASNASEDGVYRLLRALASLGLFAETGARKFRLTPLGTLLRTTGGESHAGYARLTGHDSTWRPWGQLNYSVRTGEPAFDKVFGMPIFEYLPKAPEAAAIFDAAMTSLSTIESATVVQAYDFMGIQTLMDVAGGHGLLIATVLRKHRTMRGVLFDMPHVVAGATTLLQQRGVAGRCAIESGDFFSSLPDGADAIIMKHIIHDWDDESATRILQNCHRALGPHGKVLIVDAVIPSGNEPHFGKLLDLEMLVLTPRGRERTRQEFAGLLKRSGFTLRRVIPTAGPLSVVEGVKG